MEVEVTFDEADRDPLFEIENKQEGFKYRMINNDPRRVARMRHRGWQIITSEDPEKLVMSDNTPLKKGEDVDGTQKYSDTILARMPLDEFSKHQQKLKIAQKRRSLEAGNRFMQAANGMGFDATREEKSGGGGYRRSMTQSEAENLMEQGKLTGDLPGDDGGDD